MLCLSICNIDKNNSKGFYLREDNKSISFAGSHGRVCVEVSKTYVQL